MPNFGSERSDALVGTNGKEKVIAAFSRKHELQDPKEKRNIRADERLLAVFDGKKVVSMFEMTKLVNGHLLKQDGL